MTTLREHKNKILRDYRQTLKGKAANIVSSVKYRQSSKGKAVRAKIMREYYHTPEGRAAIIKREVEYRKTPKGKTAYARMCAKRRELTTDPEAYAARVELLHTMHEPCTKCKTSYLISHQIDHIIALCLGGTDEWSNLQPLCVKCHRKKSGEDIRKLMEKRTLRGL